MFKVPEQWRFTHRTAPMSSTKEDGNNGVFLIPHQKIRDYKYRIIVSDSLGWEHVSVRLIKGNKDVKRCPTWEDMCKIKDYFWDKTDRVVQFHPPESEYVNNVEYCLHLWRPTDATIPHPPPLLVGIQGINPNMISR